MGFGSRPFWKMGLMGFIHQETFWIQNQVRRQLQNIWLIKPPLAHKLFQGLALDYHSGEGVSSLRWVPSSAKMCFGTFFPWMWFNFISRHNMKKRNNIFKCFIKHSYLLTSISINTTTLPLVSLLDAAFCVCVIFSVSFHFLAHIWLLWQSFSLSGVFSKRM